MKKLKILDLFSGIGGFSLGLEKTGGFETVAFCEIDPFCQKVLKKHWPDVPCYEDVRTMDAIGLGRIDLITGGYPCQPFSTAGNRKGDQDDRHLWPAMFDIIKCARPTWVIGENVAGHVSMGLDQVLSDLEGEGYACRPYIIPACAVDALHRRDRIWIVAHADTHIHAGALANRKNQGKTTRSQKKHQCEGKTQDREWIWPESSASNKAMAKSNSFGCLQMEPPNAGRKAAKKTAGQVSHCRSSRGSTGWLPEPHVGRVVDGIPGRVDRLKALGNAVVPQIPTLLGNAILQTYEAA